MSFAWQGLPVFLMSLLTWAVLCEVRRPVYEARVGTRTRLTDRNRARVPPLEEEMRQTLQSLEGRIDDGYEMR